MSRRRRSKKTVLAEQGADLVEGLSKSPLQTPVVSRETIVLCGWLNGNLSMLMFRTGIWQDLALASCLAPQMFRVNRMLLSLPFVRPLPFDVSRETRRFVLEGTIALLLFGVSRETAQALLAPIDVPRETPRLAFAEVTQRSVLG